MFVFWLTPNLNSISEQPWPFNASTSVRRRAFLDSVLSIMWISAAHLRMFLVCYEYPGLIELEGIHQHRASRRPTRSSLRTTLNTATLLSLGPLSSAAKVRVLQRRIVHQDARSCSDRCEAFAHCETYIRPPINPSKSRCHVPSPHLNVK